MKFINIGNFSQILCIRYLPFLIQYPMWASKSVHFLLIWVILTIFFYYDTFCENSVFVKPKNIIKYTLCGIKVDFLVTISLIYLIYFQSTFLLYV